MEIVLHVINLDASQNVLAVIIGLSRQIKMGSNKEI